MAGPHTSPTQDRQLQDAGADLDRRLSLGEPQAAEAVLAAYPQLAADADTALQIIYDELVGREHRGEQPPYDEYYQRFPQWREELRKSFDIHDTLIRHEPEPSAESPPDRGRYLLLGELGRGGMGVVYRARQPGLNRVVALKMILAGEYAAPEERARFRREAETVARLQHPNIVQVYEVGEQDGRPFLAMEYVAGGHLADRLATALLTAPEAARLVATLARAVQYAHERGVLHRDLKPTNILLRTTDERGHDEPADPNRTCPLSGALCPLVSDFGLAKQFTGDLGATAAGGRTQTGAVVGTPSYMAPEQAGGSLENRRPIGVGPPVDVWALGAILYEAVTGRPPFRGESVLDTLQQVQSVDPVPPSRLRPRLPRDLETICLKCLRKDPARRYATAKALADDLDRFLAQEPIHGRPVPVRERAWLWAERRPAAAVALGLTGGLVAALAVGAIVIASQRDQTEEAHGRAQENYETAVRHQQRAEGNLAKAHAAVDRMLSRVGEWNLANVPGLERVRRDLLQDALRLNREMVAENSGDHAARRELGRAYKRLADLHIMLGEAGPAEENYRRAIAVGEQLVADEPVAAEDADVAAGYHGLALLLQQTGRLAESERAHRHAVGLLADLPAAVADRPRYRHAMASARLDLSQLLANTGRPEEAERGYELARAAWEKLTAEFPAETDYRVGLATALNQLALLAKATGQAAAAEKAFRRSLELRERLAVDAPNNFEAKKNLGTLLNNLGSLLNDTGRLDEAERAFRRAVPLRETLADAFPRVPAYSQQLARCLNNLSCTLVLTNRHAEAEPFARRSVAVFEKLAAAFPAVPEYRYELAVGLDTLGSLLHGWKRPADADQTFRQSIAGLEKLVAEAPDDARFPSQLGGTLHNLASLQLAQGDVADARRLAEQAVRWQRQALARDPTQVEYKQALSGHLLLLGPVLVRLNRHTEAADVANELVREYSDNVQCLYITACIWAQCAAHVERATDLPAETRREMSRTYGERAVQALRDLARRGRADLKQLQTDSDLEALRQRDDFQQLLRDLERPPGPSDK